jgi:glycopeptide antibiotics resistance protein
VSAHVPPHLHQVFAEPPELPAFPVLIPLAVVTFAILLERLRRRNALTVPRGILAAALCVYAVGLCRSVLLPAPIVIGAARRALPPWQVWIQPVPVVTSFSDPVGMALNVALFVPFGALLVLLMRRPSLRAAILIGFLLSLGIETVQFLGDITISSDRVADIDDLIGNTLGTLIGYSVFRASTAVPSLSRIASAASWPTAPRSARRGPATTIRT